MRLSLYAGYELAFLITLLGMTAIAAAVIIPFRLALKRWRSPWPKALVVHTANLVVQLFLAPPLLSLLPLNQYLGILNGTVVVFCLGLMLADFARIALSQRDRVTVRRWQPAALFIVMAVLTLGATRGMVNSSAGRQMIDDLRLAISTFRELNRHSPEKEILSAMERTFPRDFDPLAKEYLAKVRVANPDPDNALQLPRFPTGQVSNFIAARYADIARAPDAALMDLAHAYAGVSVGLAQAQRHCIGLKDGLPRLAEPYNSEAASQSELHAMGTLLAAALIAARAGIDHPIARSVSPKRTAALGAQFKTAYPDAERQSRRASEQCLVVAQWMQWVGSLSPEDAAYLLAVRFDELARSGPPQRVP